MSLSAFAMAAAPASPILFEYKLRSKMIKYKIKQSRKLKKTVRLAHASSHGLKIHRALL